MLLLELLTGRVSAEHNLAVHFFHKEEEDLSAARDPRLAVAWPDEAARGVEELATRCCGSRLKARPRMGDAKRVLEHTEARHDVETALLRATLAELIGRADADAASADADLRTCAVCLEDGIPCDAGLTCDGATDNHFTCWTCVSRTVGSAAARTAAAGGLRCPAAGADCSSSPFSEAALSRGLTAEALASLRDAQLEAQKISLTAEFAAERRELCTQLAVANAQNGRLHDLRLDVEAMLTPKCPRCSSAFAGFDGCFALKCAYPEENAAAAASAATALRNGGALRFCGAGFCGWCFELCGNDAHAHVLACPHNLVAGRGYFAPMDLWEQSLTMWKKRTLEAYLAKLEPPMRAALKAAVPHLFKEAGMDA